MESIRQKRRQVKDYSEYLASGSSREQLDDVILAIAQAELDEGERQYVNLEVMPMLKTLFNASISSRARYVDWTKSAKLLGMTIAVMSMISSTQAVSEEQKWIPLLFAGIMGVFRELIHDALRASQPVLDWVSAREGFDQALTEVVHWLSQSDVYAVVPDRNKRFLEFARRIALANGNNERRIQQQLQTLLETRIDENPDIRVVEWKTVNVVDKPSDRD